MLDKKLLTELITEVLGNLNQNYDRMEVTESMSNSIVVSLEYKNHKCELMIMGSEPNFISFKVKETFNEPNTCLACLHNIISYFHNHSRAFNNLNILMNS